MYIKLDVNIESKYNQNKNERIGIEKLVLKGYKIRFQSMVIKNLKRFKNMKYYNKFETVDKNILETMQIKNYNKNQIESK